MANADKCFLNIPFKGWAQTLARAADAEGNIDPAALALGGDREFENYKAIERRINDSSCGGACPCYRVWADSGSTVLTLVASTSVSAGADMNAINESEGTFSISGQSVIGPAGLYWFALSAHFEDSGGFGGTDAVMTAVSQAQMQATGYVPDGFDSYISLSGWTELPFRPLFSLQRNSVGTREMTASVTAKLWRMCSCTPTPGGGG